ncbi:V protein [Tuhoko virus 2]|uniref:V protein n=1 Tax=Tuhoko virus 2 TaxID=798073 RepID=D8WJ31_9MONO|nr:V protein [Tuhoko virus 2]ADI80718.1 V protein [Tuhoko virus 2]
MDPSPSDEEISAWIDKGMDTVQHFISQPVNPQSSLGKNTIKSGNTKILIKSAEKKSKATKDNVTQESAPTPPPRDYQSEKKEVVRPKIRKTQGERPRPLPPIPQQEESIYEEVSREVVEEDQPLLQQQQAHVLKGKQKILSTSPVNQEPDLPTGPGGQGFKRGSRSHISTTGLVHLRPRHRREFDIRWYGNKPCVREWCNPGCSPIRPTPMRYTCTCGECPAVCSMCEGDPQILESAGEPI